MCATFHDGHSHLYQVLPLVRPRSAQAHARQGGGGDGSVQVWTDTRTDREM